MNLPAIPARHPAGGNKILYKDLSYKIVGIAMIVHSKLGYGFLEKLEYKRIVK